MTYINRNLWYYLCSITNSNIDNTINYVWYTPLYYHFNGLLIVNVIIVNSHSINMLYIYVTTLRIL